MEVQVICGFFIHYVSVKKNELRPLNSKKVGF